MVFRRIMEIRKLVHKKLVELMSIIGIGINMKLRNTDEICLSGDIETKLISNRS